VLPIKGDFKPFQYNKQEISVVKCFDIALAHNLYFFILLPLSRINDYNYKAELYEPLLKSRGGNLSDDDKKGLLRLAEEFNFDWKNYKVEL
jgi:hypothetical protein